MTTTLDSRETPWLVTDGREGLTIERWPSELPLFVISVVMSALLWIVLTITIVGIAYAAIFGAFFFFIQAVFIAHVRGNGVRLGEDQFPELYARVQDIGQRLGMEQVPDAYLMQAGGALNAFATRFLRRHIIVLYSDLLEACGDDHAARDMIIGHELGHVHAGHLKWHWFLLPSGFLPFLSSALSRAREFTCDRYGWAVAGDAEGAQLGLTILAAGGKYGRLVNRSALVRQRQDLATGWMTIGGWLASHPPLARRLHVLNPSLGQGREPSSAGVLRAAVIVGLLLLPLFAGLWYGGRWFAKSMADTVAEAQAAAPPEAPPSRTAAETEQLMQELKANVQTLSEFLQSEATSGRVLPLDDAELEVRWTSAHRKVPVPIDPFDGLSIGYRRTSTGYVLWSTGPDGEVGSLDDLQYEFEIGR